MNLAIDLDNTLAAYVNDQPHCGDWLEGAREALDQLLILGHKVCIQTCRATWEEGGGLKECKRFFAEVGFHPVVVTAPRWSEHVDSAAREVGIWMGVGKPIAHYYIDDRGITYRGDWGAVLDELWLRWGLGGALTDDDFDASAQIEEARKVLLSFAQNNGHDELAKWLEATAVTA